MEALKTIPYIFLILAIAGIIAGTGLLVTSNFGKSVDQCFNSSYTYDSTNDICSSNIKGCADVTNYFFNTTKCCNKTILGPEACTGTPNSTAYIYTGGAVGNSNYSATYYSIELSKQGSTTVAGQFTTIGIIAVMVIIISLISGVFAYMAYFR